MLAAGCCGAWAISKKKPGVSNGLEARLDSRRIGSVHKNASGFADAAFMVNALNGGKKDRGDVLSYFRYPQQDLVGWDIAIAKPNSNPAA